MENGLGKNPMEISVVEVFNITFFFHIQSKNFT